MLIRLALRAGSILAVAALLIQPGAARCQDEFQPIGPEFLLNVDTPYTQSMSDLDCDRDGNFVVAWASFGNIHVRMFWADGSPRSGEFEVGFPIDDGKQDAPRVIMNGDGDFLIIWNDWQGHDGNQMGVFGQLFHANGAPRGGPFQVNQYTAISQFDPEGDMAPDGSFVVAWSDTGRDGSAGCYARRFAADGTPLTDDFLVNDASSRSQVDPEVSMNRDGYFVIAWTDTSMTWGEPRNIAARLYFPDATPASPEIGVVQNADGLQRWASVAMANDRTWVVTWQDEDGHDGAGMGVFGRLFDFTGAPRSGEFQVNQASAGDQLDTNVFGDVSGNFIVVWTSQNGGADVYMRCYDADGLPLGDEALVHTIIDGDQLMARGTLDDSGERAIIAYTHKGDIFGRRFERRPLRIRPAGDGTPGRSLEVELHLVGNPDRPYVLAASASPGQVDLGSDLHWELGADSLFFASVGHVDGPVFYNFAGLLDHDGRAKGLIYVPTSLQGLDFSIEVAALAFDPVANVITAMTRPVRVGLHD